MGYTITIGNAVPEYPSEENGYRFSWNVLFREHPGAPANNEKPVNYRQPAYSQWSQFCDMTGLRELFFNEDYGLMREGHNVVPILPSHLAAILKADAAFRQKYPDAVPQIGTSDEDGCLARLEWLGWWIRYALDNCANPAIEHI